MTKSNDHRLCKNDYTVLLGEVIFDFDNVDISAKENYANAYKKLASKINNQRIENFEMLPEILTYQQLFKNYKLDEKVRRYYRLCTKSPY